MAVHSFGALGQRGQAEAIAAAGDESEGMMRLRAALASLVSIPTIVKACALRFLLSVFSVESDTRSRVSVEFCLGHS
jgi:hypothetical protein